MGWPETSYQALAALLRRRAADLDLSTRALGGRLGMPHTTVHKTLRGQRRLDPIEFVAWCEALDLRDPLAVIDSVRRH